MRLIIRNLQYTASNRKQNFFELNPIYPDYGEKDFDIYNVERKRVPVFDQFRKMKTRQQLIKRNIQEQFFMRKYKLKQFQRMNAEEVLDEETGLPIGVNASYDEFINQLKKNKNLRKKLQYEFKTVLNNLIKKFKVKSQIQLIKLFRISLAHSKKNDLKDKIRGKLIQEAINRAAAAKNDYFSDFFTDEKIQVDDNFEPEMTEEQLNEASFQEALKSIDQKIAKIQSQMRTKKAMKGDDWDPVYGKKITEQEYYNMDYDLNLKRGVMKAVRHDDVNSNFLTQDEQIRRRINKLFFLRKLEYLKKQRQFKFDYSQLPINLRKKEKIINQLAHKYKQEEFLIEPNMKDIYQDIDMALDRISIRFTSGNQKQQDLSNQNTQQLVDEKNFTSEELVWDKLDVEKVFATEYYSEENMNKEIIDQKDLIHVSPSAGTQLSLNRLGFNLYRHSECEVFGVFTKYRHMILQDFLKDKSITTDQAFNYFSVEEAQNLLKKIKKDKEEQVDKYYGHAHRKSSEAEVFVKQGSGKVTMNGKPIQDYFVDTYHRVQALKPLIFSETAGLYDLEFNVVGGGLHSQSECCAYALARALMKINPGYKRIFAMFALDGHDPRKKEPKRIGLYSARVRPPYVRR